MRLQAFGLKPLNSRAGVHRYAINPGPIPCSLPSPALLTASEVTINTYLRVKVLP
jgi:hypothetical protein